MKLPDDDDVCWGQLSILPSAGRGLHASLGYWVKAKRGYWGWYVC